MQPRVGVGWFGWLVGVGWCWLLLVSVGWYEPQKTNPAVLGWEKNKLVASLCSMSQDDIAHCTGLRLKMRFGSSRSHK